MGASKSKCIEKYNLAEKPGYVYTYETEKGAGTEEGDDSGKVGVIVTEDAVHLLAEEKYDNAGRYAYYNSVPYEDFPEEVVISDLYDSDSEYRLTFKGGLGGEVELQILTEEDKPLFTPEPVLMTPRDNIFDVFV